MHRINHKSGNLVKTNLKITYNFKSIYTIVIKKFYLELSAIFMEHQLSLYQGIIIFLNKCHVTVSYRSHGSWNEDDFGAGASYKTDRIGINTVPRAPEERV